MRCTQAAVVWAVPTRAWPQARTRGGADLDARAGAAGVALHHQQARLLVAKRRDLDDVKDVPLAVLRVD